MNAVVVVILAAAICQSETVPSKPKKGTADEEVARFLKLNREVQILQAERLVADEPKNRDARKLLAAARKLPLKPGPLVPSGIGQFGYWPERRVQVWRSLGGGSHLAAIGTREAVVRGVPDVPGKLLLVVTGAETIRNVGVRATKRNLQGQATGSEAYDEQYDVPVVEVLNVTKATEALEKKLAELQGAKQ